MNEYTNKPKIHNRQENKAFYSPLLDIVNIPSITKHKNAESYYSTLFHELIHSTGHKNRLNRFHDNKDNNFGSKDYSKEELIAEIGASMLCGESGIVNETIDNSVSYLDSWIKQLENDSTLIVKAAAQAQKACNYIRNELTHCNEKSS